MSEAEADPRHHERHDERHGVRLRAARPSDTALGAGLSGRTPGAMPWASSDAFGHQGQRVASGQRSMQASSGVFLGLASCATARRKRVDFCVRQLDDDKSSSDIAAMDRKCLVGYVEVCASAISGYVGKGEAFDKAMGSFAVRHADHDEKGSTAFARAAEEGRKEVVRGVWRACLRTAAASIV